MNDCRLQKYVQMHGGMMMAHVRPFVRGEVANVLRTCPLYSKNKSTSYKTRSTHQDIFRKNLRSGYNIIKKAYFTMAIRTNIGPTYENHFYFSPHGLLIVDPTPSVTNSLPLSGSICWYQSRRRLWPCRNPKFCSLAEDLWWYW